MLDIRRTNAVGNREELAEVLKDVASCWALAHDGGYTFKNDGQTDFYIEALQYAETKTVTDTSLTFMQTVDDAIASLESNGVLPPFRDMQITRNVRDEVNAKLHAINQSL